MTNVFFVLASLGFDTVYFFGTVISLRLYYVIIHYDNIDWLNDNRYTDMSIYNLHTYLNIKTITVKYLRTRTRIQTIITLNNTFR